MSEHGLAGGADGAQSSGLDCTRSQQTSAGSTTRKPLHNCMAAPFDSIGGPPLREDAPASCAGRSVHHVTGVMPCPYLQSRAFPARGKAITHPGPDENDSTKPKSVTMPYWESCNPASSASVLPRAATTMLCAAVIDEIYFLPREIRVVVFDRNCCFSIGKKTKNR